MNNKKIYSADVGRMGSAKKILLPCFELTEVSAAADTASIRIDVLDETYYLRPKMVPSEGKRRDGKPRWVKHQFNLYPIVLDNIGVPWAEANVYILSRLEGVRDPSMTTYAGIADDLAAYRRFLDENEIDWTGFPAQKLARPTYRFNGHLKYAVEVSEVAAATAKRRMGTVVAFYRWLASEGVFAPAHPAWKESDHFVRFSNSQGFTQIKKVVVTDLKIDVSKQDDPYDGCIDDGGKLRPLPLQEQEWLLDALVSLGNTEMTLIHLFSLATGARIQTALTLRVRDAMLAIPDGEHGELLLPVGIGTGIDTKNGKQMVLHIPKWFYRMLQTYACCTRAKRRRERAQGGDTEEQYLFLSQRGAPLYRSKADSATFNDSNELRHPKVGQGVRQFITERVIPFIRAKYSITAFHYKFHDMRATAGMNWTDQQLKLVAAGDATLHEAREFVMVRMGHESSAVTDRYLRYRRNLKLVRWVGMEYESYLKRLSARAMEGLK